MRSLSPSFFESTSLNLFHRCFSLSLKRKRLNLLLFPAGRFLAKALQHLAHGQKRPNAHVHIANVVAKSFFSFVDVNTCIREHLPNRNVGALGIGFQQRPDCL